MKVQIISDKGNVVEFDNQTFIPTGGQRWFENMAREVTRHMWYALADEAAPGSYPVRVESDT